MRLLWILLRVVLANELGPNEVAHDSIKPFPEDYDLDIESGLLQFRPIIGHDDSCYPYSAVTWDGMTNGGLGVGGDGPAAGCDSKAYGQIYGRVGYYNGHKFLCYGVYFPKEQEDILFYQHGYRHSWQFICLQSWSEVGVDHYYAVKYTDDGNWVSAWDARAVHGEPGKFVHRYKKLKAKSDLKTNHKYPLITWLKIPEGAKRTLNTKHWGDHTTHQMLINDVHFEATLVRVYEANAFFDNKPGQTPPPGYNNGFPPDHVSTLPGEEQNHSGISPPPVNNPPDTPKSTTHSQSYTVAGNTIPHSH